MLTFGLWQIEHSFSWEQQSLQKAWYPSQKISGNRSTWPGRGVVLYNSEQLPQYWETISIEKEKNNSTHRFVNKSMHFILSHSDMIWLFSRCLYQTKSRMTPGFDSCQQIYEKYICWQESNPGPFVHHFLTSEPNWQIMQKRSSSYRIGLQGGAPTSRAESPRSRLGK